jgi:hypothetical protein
MRLNARNLAIIIAMGLGGHAVAADWTKTLDLTQPGAIGAGTTRELGVTADAFWLGSKLPVDPNSGVPKTPQQVQERLEMTGGGQSLRSSWRDTLWLRADGPVDAALQLQPDHEFNGWGIDGEQRLVRVARDGAQQRAFTAADLGAAGYRIKNYGVAARRDRAGAWVVLAAVNGGPDRILKLDGRGRSVHGFDTASCNSRIEDDHNGGLFITCIVDHTAYVRRVSQGGDHDWTSAVSYDITNTIATTAQFGGLVLATSIQGGRRFRVIGADGQSVLERTGHQLSAYRSGFWLWSGYNDRLSHHDVAGNVIADVAHVGLNDMIAHDNGNVLVRGDFEWYFSVIDRRGRLINSGESERIDQSYISRIDFNHGNPWAQLDDYDLATLIDEDGVATSAPFRVYRENEPGIFWKAVADANTLCTEDKVARPPATQAQPWVRCMGRHSGQPLGMDKHFTMHGEILGFGPNVWLKTEQQVFVHAPSGGELAAIRLDGDFHLHPDGRGLAIARQRDGRTYLTRYGADGGVRFERALEGAGDGIRVFHGDDGRVLVYRHFLDGPLLELFGADGEPQGSARPRDWPVNHDLASAEITGEGVIMLMQTVLPDYRLRSNTVFIYDGQLGARRARHELGSSWRSYHYARLHVGDDGDVRALTPSHYGLPLYRFDLASGALHSRHVLPISDGPSLNTGYNPQFNVRRDGSLQLFHPREGELHDVLQVFRPHGDSGVALNQSAFAGAWNTRSSTGQGLVVDIDAEHRRIFAAWHTYEPFADNGLDKQRWFTLQGELPATGSSMRVPIYRNRDGAFDAIGSTAAVVVGEAELVASSCDRLELWFRIGEERGAIPLTRSGSRWVSCISGATELPSQGPRPAIDVDGFWFDPARSGQGIGFASSSYARATFGGWFTYDLAGHADDADSQHWFTLQGRTPAAYGEAAVLTIYRSNGGSRNGKPTRNTNKVGQATLLVHDCERATLTYRFDDSAVAGAFAELERGVGLRRFGRCHD